MDRTERGADRFLEKFLVQLPILFATVAISFDVGYFWGIDINYFTLFSLSEHLLFAIEALPNALGIVVIIWMAMFAIGLLIFMAKFFSAMFGLSVALPKANVDFEAIKLKYSQNSRQRRAFLFRALIFNVVTFGVAYLGYAFVFRYLDRYALLVVVFLSYLLAGWVFLVGQMRFLFLGVGFGVASTVASLIMGHSLARSYVSGDSPTQEFYIKGEGVAGRLIRSGERGVLFLRTADSRLVFKPWQDIDHISGPSDGIRLLP